MKGNGKDGGGTVIVQGNATPRSTAIALMVKNANVSAQRDGGSTATLSIVGRARIPQSMCGSTVEVVTAGNRRILGQCVDVGVSAGKKEGERLFRAKVAHVRAHNLDEIVNMQVQMQETQAALPGLQDEDTDQPALKPAAPPQSADEHDKLRSLRPKDHAQQAVNPPPKPHARAGARRSADGGPWTGAGRGKRGPRPEAHS